MLLHVSSRLVALCLPLGLWNPSQERRLIRALGDLALLNSVRAASTHVTISDALAAAVAQVLSNGAVLDFICNKVFVACLTKSLIFYSPHINQGPNIVATGNMNIPFSTILTSPIFTFHIGVDGTEMMLPKALIAHQSTAFDRLVNGEMCEARDGFAKLDDVDEATFVRFGQWMYTRSYEVRNHSNLERKIDIIGLHAWDYGLSPMMKRRKQKEMILDGTWDSRITHEDMVQAEEATRVHEFNPEQSKRQAVWSKFTRRSNYTLAMPPRANSTIKYSDLAEIFLAHAELYCFADKYGVENLSKLCLQNLRVSLIDCECHDTQMGGLLELLAFVAENTPPISGHGENLRSVLLDYFVIIYELVAENEIFQELLERNSTITKEFMLAMRQRLD